MTPFSTANPIRARVPAPLFHALLAAAALTALAGCAAVLPGRAANPGAAPAVAGPGTGVGPASAPVRFPWSDRVLEAAATGTTPVAARTRAVRELRQQVRALPANAEANVGQAMDSYLAVRRDIETACDRAAKSDEQRMDDGTWKVTLRLNLAPVARILERANVTPDQPLPETPPSPEGQALPPVV